MDLRLLTVGRLAPTPSGALHLGNALAFAAAWLSARAAGGRVLLRVEDVDTQRARPSVAAQIREDLRWLGLDWDEERPPQSARDYAPWLDRLAPLTYRCRCTRQELADNRGVYPGTCRHGAHEDGAVRFALPEGTELVLDRRLGARDIAPSSVGDPVLRRRDGVFAYNLAVVADDIADGVTEVVRGADLLEQTAAQIPIWRAFGATPPTWLHAPLVLGTDGRKLSKSARSLHLGAMREAAWEAEDLRRLLLAWLGIPEEARWDEAIPRFSAEASPPGDIQLALPPDGGCPSPKLGLHWKRTDSGAFA